MYAVFDILPTSTQIIYDAKLKTIANVSTIGVSKPYTICVLDIEGYLGSWYPQGDVPEAESDRGAGESGLAGDNDELVGLPTGPSSPSSSSSSSSGTLGRERCLARTSRRTT